MSKEAENLTNEIAAAVENWKPTTMAVKGMKPPMDLTNDVTVFVSTVGDRTNFKHCIDALDHQDSLFRFDTIDHVAPMSAAFQAMIDRCETPYYVQVDEDMILDPYAIRILYDAISKAPPTMAIVCYSLWDDHMDQAILGVKIYRHAAVKYFPYNPDVPNCDTEQNARLEAAGYTVQVFFGGYEKNLTCIGHHGAHYTPATAYEAYHNRAVKSRLFPEWMSWARRLESEFRQRIGRDPTNLVDLYAFLGFSAGLTADLAKVQGEKDWRTVDHDFRRLQADLETALPTQLNLHVTSKCNLYCQFCTRRTTKAKPKPDMTVDMVKKALAVCPTTRSVCIAGLGEPLLCSHLDDIMWECKGRGLVVGIITNGVLLADFAKVLKGWGTDLVSVSLNAATAESHRAINQSDTWDRVLDGIREAVKLMPKRVTVSMVVHRDNVAEMPAFLELAAGLNVTTVDFLTILPDANNPEAWWDKRITEDQQATIDAVKQHPESKRVQTWPMVLPTTHCPRACRSPYDSLSVDSEGWVSPCRRVMPPSKAFGNVSAPAPPWRLAAWYELRAALEGDRELPDVCRTCFGNYTG